MTTAQRNRWNVVIIHVISPLPLLPATLPVLAKIRIKLGKMLLRLSSLILEILQ
jgi:hypothetical protein